MKKLLLIILILWSFAGFAQNRINIRADTVAIMKQNGNGELLILNRTRDSAGYLMNIGGGRTAFRPIPGGGGGITAANQGLSIVGSTVGMGGTINTNATVSLAADLFIGDNIGVDFQNGAATLELFGPTIKLNRGWSGIPGTPGLPAGASTDSVVTINQTTGQVRMRNASSFGGSDSALFATQYDLSTGKVYCPVYIDTIQDKTVINGATNTKDNSFPYVERTNTGKLVYGVYKGRVHGAGGLNQYATSTNNGVTISAFTDGQTDTLYNWRNFIPSRLRGDTIGITEVAGTNGRVYIRRSVNDFTSFSARDSIQVSGVTWLFSEGKVQVFAGYNAMPVYSYSPDVDRSGVAYKTAFTGGTWAVTWFPNSTALQMNEAVLVPDDDTLFAFVRSELNVTTLYRTWTTDLITWATPVAVTCPEYYAGKPDVIKMPDGRYLGNFRSREGSPVVPDEGIISISNDKGLTWTILRELRQEYYTYGNLLHMGDNTYLLAYATQIPVPYASLYQMFFVVPSCDLNTNSDQKVYEKYGAPFNILKDYIDRKSAAAGTLALTAGSVTFVDPTGTALAQDNTKLYWDNTLDQLSVGVNTGGARLAVKQFSSTAGTGIKLIQTGVSNANAGIDFASGILSLNTATDAAPTTYTARLLLYEPTATGSNTVVNINSQMNFLHDGTIQIPATGGIRQHGNGIFRLENVGVTRPTNATGLGHEFFVAGGIAYWNPYNATTVGNGPAGIISTQLTITGPTQSQKLTIQGGYPMNYAGNAGDLGSPANGWTNYNTTTQKFRVYENGAWKDWVSTGSSTGGGYKVSVDATNIHKTLKEKYGIILDSATAGEVGIKADTATLFPAIRSTIVQGGGVLYYGDPIFEPNDSTIRIDSTKMKIWPGSIITGATMSLGSDATGDIYYRNSGGVLTRLGVGTNGHVLTLASGLPSWAAAAGGVSLAAIGAAPNANAATLTGTVLNLEPASASFGGVVTTGTQTFAGNKTLSGETQVNVFLNSGGGIMRFQNTGSTRHANSTGVGFEFFTAGGISYASAWNATTSAYSPLNFTGSTIDFGGISRFLNNVKMDGNLYVGANTTPTAKVHIAAGAAGASTAPLKFTSGTNMTTAEAGAMEWNGTNLFITQTSGPTRKTIAYTTDIVTPTFQQVLTAGSTLTGANTINAGGNDLSFSNFSSFNVGTGRMFITPTDSYLISPDGNTSVAVSNGEVLMGAGQVRIDGSFAGDYIAKTATYTLTSADFTVEVTSGTHTQTLPTAVGITGRIYVITNSGAGVVTVGTTSSQTFVNVTGTPTTLTLNQFNSVIVQSNGANWLRISSL